MAARTRKVQLDQKHKDAIRASQLENRLTDHAFNRVAMTRTQVAAALGVLKKLKPDLAATEISGEMTQVYVAEMPKPVADLAEWQTKYADKPLDTQH